MNSWRNLTIIFRVTVVLISLSCLSHGQVTGRLSTTFLARGEQAIFEISVAGGKPVGPPQVTQPKNIGIQEANLGPLTRMMPGRRLEYVYQYNVMGYDVGRYTIPAVRVNVDGDIVMTEPVDFVIFNPDELQASEVELGGRTYRYYSTFRTLNDRPYENETTPTEIKIFVPLELVIDDWGIPDFERDGLAAWRFQPSPMRSAINLLGQTYYSVAYPSTITPTRTGKISIGPAKVRLVTRMRIQDPYPRDVNAELYLQVPKLEMEAQPLPAGAPDGFENAVGSFHLGASIITGEIQEGDPITIDLTVTGSGNLDTMRPPKLADVDGWKVYSTTTEQRGDERRDLSGSVVFHQSIRPLELKQEIPPFRLIYFDPRDKSYKTLTTEPIALRMIPSPLKAKDDLTQALPVPFERMNDILALVRPAQLNNASTSAFPTWIVHVIGTLLALILILKASASRLAHLFIKDPDARILEREIREIEKSSSSNDSDFLKAAGGFIERRLGSEPGAELQAVLAERDAVCFRAEKPGSFLDRKRRNEILRLLRNAPMILIAMLALCHCDTARSEDASSQAFAAFDGARYDEAIKLWIGAGNYQNLSADTLYNIGNACYRSGSPGYAALYYRRALIQDSGHQEARQNLRFIERKYGSISVQRPDYQYAVARFPITTWQNALWLGLWLCGLALLVFPATRNGARLRWVAVGALVIGPLLVSAGVLGWRYFPNDAAFAPISRQAVIVVEKVALHTDAARTAPEVIDAPPGSLCEIIRESGDWVYVAFATKTRGWVLRDNIEMVQPKAALELPKFRKLKGSGKSA